MKLRDRVSDVLEYILPLRVEEEHANEFYSRVNDVGIFSLVNAYLLSHSGRYEAVLSSDFWVRNRIYCSAQRLLYKSTLRRVSEGFSGFPCIVLKGDRIARLLYGASILRESSDLDLLVSSESLADAKVRLEGMGYACVSGQRTISTNESEYYPLDNQGLFIDLHWNLLSPPLRSPDFSRLYRDSIKESDCEINYLGDADFYVELLMHAHRHLLSLKNILDLAAYWDHFGDKYLGSLELYLKEHGIWNIAVFYAGILSEMTGNVHPHDRKNKYSKLGKLCAQYLHGILNPLRRWNGIGGKVLPQDSNFVRQASVFTKNLSMLLLDSHKEKIRCFGEFFFKGPHFLGRWLEGMRSHSDEE